MKTLVTSMFALSLMALGLCLSQGMLYDEDLVEEDA